MDTKLRWTTAFLMRLNGLLGLVKHGRPTHTWGVGARGSFKVTESPDFPLHDFFEAGKEYPLQLRHATISSEDDACKDVRSGSLKFSHDQQESPLDLIMNTGPESVFWNIKTFLEVVWSRFDGEAGLQKYCAKYPDAYRAARDAVRRAPDSFGQLRYYTQIPFHFNTRDGKTMLAKFKLGPFEDLPDSGVVSGEELWHQDRLPGESRALDYLRQDFINRFANGEVKYRLYLQLHTIVDGESEEIYNSTTAWDESHHPWLELGVATLTEALTYDECELLAMCLTNMPASISIIPAKSLSDYNSVGYTRSKVYKYAQILRLKYYKKRKKIGPEPHSLADFRFKLK